MAALSLFLIGKTGHGKSSTGNSLLGRDTFEVSDSSESVTYSAQMGKSDELGRSVTVIDCPGIGDTRMDSVESFRKACSDIHSGLLLNSIQGVSAFLLVIKYGIRLTAEELATFSTLKAIFGENFVRDHCIMVFTHGELFDMKHRKSGTKFATWLYEQTGPLQDLLEECDHRFMLAYNLEPEKMEDSIQLLLSQVETLVDGKGCYTLANYDQNEWQRRQMDLRLDAPRLQHEYQSKVNSLTSDLTQIQTMHQTDAYSHLQALAKIALVKDDANELSVQLTEADSGVGILTAQIQACDGLLGNIRSVEDVIHQEKANEARRRELEAMQERERQLQAEQEYYRRREEERRRVEERRRQEEGGCTIL